MLRYIKHHMESIDQVSVYPIVSLIIFVVFFVGLFLWIYTLKKPFIEDAKSIPFE